MELPSDIWNVIIAHIGSVATSDVYARAGILFLPLVNKRLLQICKAHPIIQDFYLTELMYCTRIMDKFASDGNIACLKFAYENGYTSDQRLILDHRIIHTVAENENFEILEYLISHGHPYDHDNIKSRITSSPKKDLQCLEYIDKVLKFAFTEWDIEKTIQYGYIEKFEYLWARGIRPKWTAIPGFIISNPSLKTMVDKLLEKNFRPDIKTFEHYYEDGNMHMYEYTYTNGYSWPDDVTVIAVRKNRLQGLQYAHEHGAKWHPHTCLVACENGSFDCLAYAHEHGAEWDFQTCLEGATNYLRKAVEALDEPDYGFSMGYLPPVYDEPGLLKCIKHLLAHQNCKYGSDHSHVVLPSEADQRKMCKDYLDQQGALMKIDFSVMYNRIYPPLNAKM